MQSYPTSGLSVWGLRAGPDPACTRPRQTAYTAPMSFGIGVCGRTGFGRGGCRDLGACCLLSAALSWILGGAERLPGSLEESTDVLVCDLGAPWAFADKNHYLGFEHSVEDPVAANANAVQVLDQGRRPCGPGVVGERAHDADHARAVGAGKPAKLLLDPGQQLQTVGQGLKTQPGEDLFRVDGRFVRVGRIELEGDTSVKDVFERLGVLDQGLVHLWIKQDRCGPAAGENDDRALLDLLEE